MTVITLHSLHILQTYVYNKIVSFTLISSPHKKRLTRMNKVKLNRPMILPRHQRHLPHSVLQVLLKIEASSEPDMEQRT